MLVTEGISNKCRNKAISHVKKIILVLVTEGINNKFRNKAISHVKKII